MSVKDDQILVDYTFLKNQATRTYNTTSNGLYTYNLRNEYASYGRKLYYTKINGAGIFDTKICSWLCHQWNYFSSKQN